MYEEDVRAQVDRPQGLGSRHTLGARGKVAPSMLRKRLERDRKLRELARFRAPA
jgi:hypothetical protein